MSRSRISVAMCTYNGERYLQEQLDSIKAQYLIPDEMVVCDDGSSDSTPSILREFSATAPFPVRVISNRKNLGVAQNFSQAIALCQGDAIVLCDQDDIWKPQKTQRLWQALEDSSGASYAFSDAEMVSEAGTFHGETLWKAVRMREVLPKFHGTGQVETLLRHNLIPGSSMAIRSSFKEIYLPIPAGWMHDYWFALLGSSLSCGVPVDETLFSYRRHAEQVCGWRKKTYWQVVRDSLRTEQDESWGKLSIFRQLLERLSHRVPPVETGRLEPLREKELHLARRAQIRSGVGVRRLASVLREAASGRYQRFSNSWESIVRDVLQTSGQQV